MSASLAARHAMRRENPAGHALLCAILLALSLALMPLSAHAVVDLLAPTNGTVTSNSTLVFEYYVSMQNLTSCDVLVNANAFADQGAKTNTINGVKVQNITAGTYSWNVTCTNGQTTETSATRSFMLDVQPPTLALVAPAPGTHKNISLDIIPADETSQTLACAAAWNGQTLEAFNASSNAHYTKTYQGMAGNGTLNVTCQDSAGNTVSQTRNLTIIPDFGLVLALDKGEYGLGETARLTIQTISGANVSINICPDQQGFVQCATALLATSEFPQTISLPSTNKTGAYLIEGLATYSGQTKLNQTRYRVDNTISVTITPSVTPQVNKSLQLTATIGGGIAPYRTSWRLSNGSVINDNAVVSIRYASPGNYTEQLTVTDQQNNTKAVNATFTISPSYLLTVYVRDNTTGGMLDNVEVDIDDQTIKTLQGAAQFTLEEGRYRIFASAPGYEFALEERYVNSTQSTTLSMARSIQEVPKVTVQSPAAGATLYSPAAIRFSVTHKQPTACTLYTSSDGSWFSPAGTMNVSDSNPKEFTADLQPGSYTLRIECADRMSRLGVSGVVPFTVAQPQGALTTTATSTAPSADELALQAAVERIDTTLSNMDAYGPKEKEIIAVIGFDKGLRNAKRTVQQAIRDINDLQFRKELDDAGKEAERKRIIGNVNTRLATTPIGITVTDTKTYVKYVKEDEMERVAATLAGLGGLSSDAKALRKQLLPDQQKFTVSTKLAQVEYLYSDNTTKTVTVVTRSLTYAQGISQEYKVYEIIPKEVAQSARDLTMVTEGEIVKDDPVLRYGLEETVTYVIPKRVDFTRMEDVKTVLARPYAQERSMITGFAIFDGAGVDGMMLPLIILGAIILLAYVAYYLNFGKQLRALMYRLGRKEKAHYLRVVINDAIDNLESNNYEKADLLYKEIRLTYDTLPTPAKNDLYEDIMGLVKRMDAYYFNMVMVELDKNIKANDMDAAIHSYEKLTGTFSRLDPESQQQLVNTVTAMARRIGLEVAA